VNYSREEKTLEELEGDNWGDPTYGSHVVMTCHAIRRKRVCDLTVEELRLAIGQEMGLAFLLPAAVSHLQREPLAAGDFFPGDLLVKVLRVRPAIWQSSPPLKGPRADVIALETGALAAAAQMDDFWKDSYLAELRDAFAAFGENSD
jgi:hypothetical protein